MKLYFWFK